MKNNIKKKIKENKGFTLVEVLIAIIILAIVSVVMVQGVSMARKAYSANKIKTEAIAIANREIEIIRSMVFSNIDIGNDVPIPIPVEDAKKGFAVTRSVTLEPESNDKIKKVIIDVSNPSLVNNVKVVTEIFAINTE